jgi:hypothetical protein
MTHQQPMRRVAVLAQERVPQQQEEHRRRPLGARQSLQLCPPGLGQPGEIATAPLLVIGCGDGRQTDLAAVAARREQHPHLKGNPADT